MGKKGTKRKTQWRTLSITECPEHSNGNCTTSSAHSTTETNIEEAISLGDDFKCSTSNNHLYLKRMSSLNSPPNYKNDYRNSSNPNHSYYNNKHNSTSSTSSLFSSRYSYRRRPFSQQNGSSSSKYYTSYGAGRATSRGHRTISETRDNNNKENTKPLFNEDDYTRITTPRQDVIFKKGYFSQPKKYLSSTDTNTNSSATASVVSAEESMSATSVPSLSPEQCSSQADSLDPEQGFMYSFIDQNGVLYVNPYMPNNFDPFNGQMLMLPYGYSPYNMCSPDNNSPSVSVADSEQNQTSVDSNENLDDLNKDISKDIETDESTVKETDKSLPEEADKSLPEEADKSLPEEADKTSPDVILKSSIEEIEENSVENPKEKEEVNANENEECKEMKDDNKSETAQKVAGNYFGYGYQQYYPQIYYPCFLPQQFMSTYGADCDASKELCDDDMDSCNKVRYRCRNNRDNVDGNSTGVSATTTDYSEDEFSDQENITDNRIDNEPTSNKETETKQITLNTDVKEFVPRAVIKSNLNVNVKEFLPKSYTKSQQEKSVIVEPEANPVTETKQDEIKETLEPKSPPPSAKIVKKTSPTLAEKIRKSMAEEFKTKASPTIIQTKTTTPNRRENVKKKPKKLEHKSEPKTSLSYAQIATKAKLENLKVEEIKPIITVQDEKVNEVMNKEPVEPISPIVDTWQTVKPRGKRGKLFKELPVTENEIIEEKKIITNHIKDVIEELPSAIQGQQKDTPTSPSDSIVERTSISSDNTPTITKKKTPKSRSRKSSLKKTPPLATKKAKKLELIEPEFEVFKKTETLTTAITTTDTLQQEDNSAVPEEDTDDNLSTPKLITPATSEQDLTLDHLYSLGRKMENGFGRNTLDRLTGFDYKFNKNNSGILKEEEEMVLNVIKSINNGFDKKPEILHNGKLDFSQIVEDIEDMDDKTIVQSCDVKELQCDSETDSVSELSSDEVRDQSLEGSEVEDREIVCQLEDCIVEEQFENNFKEDVLEAKTDTLTEAEVKSEFLIQVLDSTIANPDNSLSIPSSAEKKVNECLVQSDHVNYVTDHSNTICESEIKTSTSTEQNSTNLCNSLEENIVICEEDNDHVIIDNRNEKEEEQVAYENTVESNLVDTDTDEVLEPNLKKDLESFNEMTNTQDEIIENNVSTENKECHNIINNHLTESDLVSSETTDHTNTTTESEHLIQNEISDHNFVQDEKNNESDLVSICNDKDDEIAIPNGVGTVLNCNITETCAEEESGNHNNQEQEESTINLQNGGLEKVSDLEKSTQYSSLIQNDDTLCNTNICNGSNKENNKDLCEDRNNTSDSGSVQNEFHDSIKYENTLQKDEISSPESSFEFTNVSNLTINSILTNGTSIQCEKSLEPNTENSLNQDDFLPKNSTKDDSKTIHCKNCENNFNSTQILNETSSKSCLQNGYALHDNIKVEKLFASEIMAENSKPSTESNDKTFEKEDVITETKQIYPETDAIFNAQNSSHNTNTAKSVIPLETKEDYQNSLNTASTVPQEIEFNSEDNIHKTQTSLIVEQNVISNTNHLPSKKDEFIKTNSERCDTQIVSYNSNKPSLSESKTSPTNETKGGAKYDYDGGGGGGTDPKEQTNNFPISTTTDKNFKFPLTTAIRQWLTEETKEKTPEPILRLPSDPNLSSSIKTLIEQNVLTSNDDWSSTDESSYEDDDDDNYNTSNNSKNLKSNPSDVSFVNCSIDNDSDYNSDNQQQRYDDDNTYERVAIKLSDSIQQKCDLLDYWDDEFCTNPRKWLNTNTSRNTSIGRESLTSLSPRTISSTSSTRSGIVEPLTQYDSVYGHSIDYNQLLASNYEFLSNNILSFNNDIDHNTTTSNRGYHNKNINNNKNDTSLNNNNFDNDIHRSTTTHTNNNGNCLKPPEVCCILM